MTINIKCHNCEKEFKTYPSLKAKFCSKKCFQEYTKKQTVRKNTKICLVCGKAFVPKHPKSPGLFCSYKCRGIADRKERVERSGYWYKIKIDHPRATSQGYVAEHVLVMEKSIGRYLTDDEVVHHKDRNRKNNKLSNLRLMLNRDHKSLHMSLNHVERKVCTQEQRERASIRMRLNNPCINAKRGNNGRFIKEL